MHVVVVARFKDSDVCEMLHLAVRFDGTGLKPKTRTRPSLKRFPKRSGFPMIFFCLCFPGTESASECFPEPMCSSSDVDHYNRSAEEAADNFSSCVLFVTEDAKLL